MVLFTSLGSRSGGVGLHRRHDDEDDEVDEDGSDKEDHE